MSTGVSPRRRVNIVLSHYTLQLLDELTPSKKRSQFIDEAIISHIERVKTRQLVERLKAGYAARAERDRALAEEGMAASEEAYSAQQNKRRRRGRANA